MNYRSREYLNLCYQHECMLQIPGVCQHGAGEPCHANWPEFGKGMGIKAHDCYVVPGCRACHTELDQGARLTGEQRRDTWLRAFLRYLPRVFLGGLVTPKGEPKPPQNDVEALEQVHNRMYGGQPKSRRKPSLKTGHANGRSTESPTNIYKRPHPSQQQPE